MEEPDRKGTTLLDHSKDHGLCSEGDTKSLEDFEKNSALIDLLFYRNTRNSLERCRDIEGKSTSREIRREGIVIIQAGDSGSFEEGGNCRREDFLPKQLER